VQSAFVAAAPPEDPNVAAEIKQETQEADQAEREVATALPPSSSLAPSAPVRIAEGQTIDEVTAALGQPKRVVDLGSKKIYVYPDMKITFKGGKVSDVQ
jgi:hypothetical protein